MSTKEECLINVHRVFTPTAPVDEKSLFAGRTSQLQHVIEAINQKGQHVIIFGERGVGKTSLSNVLSAFLPIIGGRNFVTPRVNCDSSDTFESVFDKSFKEIELIQTTQTMGFKSSHKHQKIDARSFLEGGFTPDNVRRALTLLSKKFLPVIILDEFDRLREEVKHGIADTVKSISDHGVDATIIMVGVADTVAELINEHASVERALIQVPMPRMTDAEISEVIDKGLGVLQLTIDEKAKKSLQILSQGLPHYTHLICLHSTKHCILDESDVIKQKHVDSAITQALDNSQQSILHAYHTATMSPRKDNLFSDVLLACALAQVDQMGYFAAQDIREPMKRITGKNYEIPSFSQHLNDFCENKRGPILKKIGSARRYRFRFINPLLQPYVVMQGCKTGKVDIINVSN